MEVRAPDSYLETEVMTATPQKRQRMLLDAAIRFIGRARQHWRAEEDQKEGARDGGIGTRESIDGSSKSPISDPQSPVPSPQFPAPSPQPQTASAQDGQAAPSGTQSSGSHLPGDAGEHSAAATKCLLRAQDIMSELMAALDHRTAPNLTKRVAALYVFVFRALVDANLHRDEQTLDDALRVLEPQREAWQDVCEQTAGADGSHSAPDDARLGTHRPVSQLPPDAKRPACSAGSDDSIGLSLEA